MRVTLKAAKPKGFQGKPQTIGEHLKARRLSLGRQQKDVARELGVDAASLLNWEKGRREPVISAYPAILAFLGYDPFPAPETIGGHLKARRRALGLSIEKAAVALGVDPASVLDWEHGGIVLYREHRARVAGFLGIEPEAVHAQMARAWNDAHGRTSRS